MKKIYCVIPVRNLKKETLRCLAELFQTTIKNYELKVIVIDNASEDGTKAAVGNKFSKIILISNKVNKGFSAAINQGLRLALKDKDTEFVLLLNNDTFLTKVFIQKLIKTADSNSLIGIVAPTLKHYQNDKLFFGMEGYVDLKWGVAYHRNIKKISSKKLIYAQFVSGCCMLIKKEVIQNAGFMDERYFLYLDDVDYCLSARQAGFKIVLDPSIVIGHKVSASFGKNPLKKIPYSFSSNINFVLKWTPIFYKPLAIIRCLYFYPLLLFIWEAHLLKKKIFHE